MKRLALRDLSNQALNRIKWFFSIVTVVFVTSFVIALEI